MGVANVDDRSWDISYSNGWFLGGTDDEFDTTTHGVNFAGATATFAFTGTSVTVYGTVSDQSNPGGGPVSTYSLDGGTAKTFAAIPATTVKYKVPYYTSPKLAQGYHTLVITTTRENSTFWLDYISYTFDDVKSVVTPASTPASSTSSTTPSQQQPTAATTNVITPGTTSSSVQVSTPLSSSRSTTISQANIFTTNSDGKTITYSTSGEASSSGSSAAFIPQSTSSTSGSKSTVSSGTIIGSAIGGVVLLIAIILLVWVLWRRRRRGAAYIPTGGTSSSDDAQSFQAGHISTFVQQPATYQPYPVNREFHKPGPSYAPAMQPGSQGSEAGGSGISSMYASDDGAPNAPLVTSPAVARLYYDETPSSSKARAIAVVYEPHPFEDPRPPSYYVR